MICRYDLQNKKNCSWYWVGFCFDQVEMGIVVTIEFFELYFDVELVFILTKWVYTVITHVKLNFEKSYMSSVCCLSIVFLLLINFIRAA